MVFASDLGILSRRERETASACDRLMVRFGSAI
jgi:hypothetical protein